jgi:hypothetical protein
MLGAMRWQVILLGVVASWAGAARAACDGIEMVTYSPDTGEAIAVSCHTGSELFLPWVDGGVGAEARDRAAEASHVPRSEILWDLQELRPLRAQNINELAPSEPNFDLPKPK